MNDEKIYTVNLTLDDLKDLAYLLAVRLLQAQHEQNDVDAKRCKEISTKLEAAMQQS